MTRVKREVGFAPGFSDVLASLTSAPRSLRHGGAAIRAGRVGPDFASRGPTMTLRVLVLTFVVIASSAASSYAASAYFREPFDGVRENEPGRPLRAGRWQ